MLCSSFFPGASLGVRLRWGNVSQMCPCAETLKLAQHQRGPLALVNVWCVVDVWCFFYTNLGSQIEKEVVPTLGGDGYVYGFNGIDGFTGVYLLRTPQAVSLNITAFYMLVRPQ